MTDPRPTLSSDPERFTHLLNEALAELHARDLPTFLNTLAGHAGRAQQVRDSSVLIEWLESVAITHALRHNPEYRVAVKDVLAHDHEEPATEDLEALRRRLSIPA